MAAGTPVFSMSSPTPNPRSGMAPGTPPPFNGSSSMSARPGASVEAAGPGASSPAHTALDMGEHQPRGGDFVTRTWQPARAPDATAVAEVTSETTKSANVAELIKATGLGQEDIQTSTSRATDDDGLIVRQRPRARADNIAVRKARAAREGRPEVWFDPNDGGVLCQADPVPPGVDRARPARWFDPEAPYLQTVPATDARIDLEVTEGAGVDRTYRFDISVGRLEFSCHPLMSKEDFLAAQLEESFRSYKRREASDLVTLYTAKSQAAAARANALRQEMAAGAALWLAGVTPVRTPHRAGRGSRRSLAPRRGRGRAHEGIRPAHVRAPRRHRARAHRVRLPLHLDPIRRSTKRQRRGGTRPPRRRREGRGRARSQARAAAPRAGHRDAVLRRAGGQRAASSRHVTPRHPSIIRRVLHRGCALLFPLRGSLARRRPTRSVREGHDRGHLPRGRPDRRAG